jgi:hypothetical protein
MKEKSWSKSTRVSKMLHSIILVVVAVVVRSIYVVL